MATHLIPYLVMNGNGQEAIQFYQQALDAKVVFFQTFGDMPKSPDFSVPAEARDRVLHATLQIGESELMLSDTFPGQPHHSGNQVTICVSTDDADQTKKIYEALQQGGQVVMPLQETFFSPAYAIVVDKFGVTFQLHTQKS